MVYKVKYNHKVYKPSNYEVMKEQERWELEIEADSFEEAKNRLREEHGYNPFYFSINGTDLGKIR